MHTILVVDDEERLRRALGRSLGLKGRRTLAACSGEEALGLVREKNVDLVITDLAMPGMDGMNLVRHVKRTAPDLKTIILTAYGTPESQQEAQELGVDCFLAKPFDLSYLKAKVDELLPAEAAPEPRPAESTGRGEYGAWGRLCFSGGRTLGKAAVLTRRTTRCFLPLNVLFGLGRATGTVSQFAKGFRKRPGDFIYGLGRAAGAASGIPAAFKNVR